MADITIVADIPLFHTIAQTSATFVAIIAGFYTTKIITLSNEQRRVLQRINELDNDLQAKIDYKDSLKKTESDTTNQWDEERINGFIGDIYSDFYLYEQIHSFEDLRKWYEKTYEYPLTGNEERILKERAPTVLKELEELREKRKGRSTLREATVSPIPLDRSVDSALANDRDINRFQKLRDKIGDLQAEIRSLQKMKKYNQHEYNSVAYPKFIKFGFVSLVVFAILGVISPLTYEWWVIPLFTYYDYRYNVNLLVVVLFIIGLSITFSYIGLELYYATPRKNAKKIAQERGKEPK